MPIIVQVIWCAFLNKETIRSADRFDTSPNTTTAFHDEADSFVVQMPQAYWFAWAT
jgi:hypothetical protein